MKYGELKSRDLLCSITVEVHKIIRGVLSVMCVSRVAETLLVAVTFKCIGCSENCVFGLNRLEMNMSLFPK